jgi:lipoate-protein ligase B
LTEGTAARVLNLGRRSYREVLELQREIHGAVSRDEQPDTWIVVEHDPVVTLGRNSKRENLLASSAALLARGVDLVDIERGGDATYHGPGQLVVYPILKLPRFREIVPLVSKLERATIATLASYGIAAGTRPEHRGVYVGDRAIAAVGIAVRQMTSLHGLSLNVSLPLDYSRLIVPCGTPQFGITSLATELSREVTLDEVRPVLLGALADAFDARFEYEAVAC